MLENDEETPALARANYMMHYKEFKNLLQLWLLHPNDPQIVVIARKVLTSEFWDFGTPSTWGKSKQAWAEASVSDGGKWLRQLFDRKLLQEAKEIQTTLTSFMIMVQDMEEQKRSLERHIRDMSENSILESELAQVARLHDQIGALLWETEQYASLNYKAFYKTLRKYDAHLDIKAVKTYMPIINKMLSLKVSLQIASLEDARHSERTGPPAVIDTGMDDEIECISIADGVQDMDKKNDIECASIVSTDADSGVQMISPASHRSKEVELFETIRRASKTSASLATEMREDWSDENSTSSDGSRCTACRSKAFYAHIPNLMPPIVQNLCNNYGRKQFADDVVCSIVTAVAGIPKAMAYAGLTGMSVTSGIATLYVPCLVYSLFGSSRQIAISPQSVTCLLLAQVVDDTLIASGHSGDMQEKIALTMMYTLCSGLVMVAFGVFNLGVLLNFISRPVLSGFVSASALIAAFSTVKSLLGIHVKKSPILYTLIVRVCEALPDIHWPTACIALIGIAMMVCLPILQKAACRRLEKRECGGRCFGRCCNLIWYIMKVPSVVYIVIFGVLLGGYLCEFRLFVQRSTVHTVKGRGATSISPFYEQVGQRFDCDYQDERVTMEYEATGSGEGLRTFLSNGTTLVDFATTDVPPSQESLAAYGIQMFPVSTAFICPMVNIPFLHEQITMVLDIPVVAAIFAGEITSWTDLQIRRLNPNLPWDAIDEEVPITVISRSDESGTTLFFSEALRDYKPVNRLSAISPGLIVNWSAPLQKEAHGNKGVVDAVLSNPWSIGYTSWSSETGDHRSCAAFSTQEGTVTTKLAWKQRNKESNSGHHQFAWPIQLVNYMLLPSSDDVSQSVDEANQSIVDTNQSSIEASQSSAEAKPSSADRKPQDACLARRWLHAYLESIQAHANLASLGMFELMELPDMSNILCPNDRQHENQKIDDNRRLSGEADQQIDDKPFECPHKDSTCSDIKMVGYFPSSFPSFDFPTPKMQHSFGMILANSLLLSAVALLEHVANAKLYAERHGYHVSISQDLVAVGMSNVLGSCFGSFIVAGGFSRSALNARAASQVSGFLSVFVSLIVVSTVAPLLAILPDVVLNVILVVAVLSIVDYKIVLELVRLGSRGLQSLLMLGIAFFATCFLGVTEGMILAVGFSLVIFVYNSAYPRIAVLSRRPGQMVYEMESDIAEKPKTFDMRRSVTSIFAEKPKTFDMRRSVTSMFSVPSANDANDSKKVKILRFEAPLWYANVSRLHDRVAAEILFGTKGLVLDLSTVSWVDVTACTVLKKTLAHVDSARVHLVFANTNREVRYMIQSTCNLPDSRFFASLYQSEMAAELWGQECDVQQLIKQGLAAKEILTPKSWRSVTRAW